MGILLTQRDGAIIGNIAKVLGFLMNGIFELLSSIGIVNIGLCIILFTIIIYTILLPMTIKQQKTTKIMSVMNPELQAIQKKYANKKDQASMLKMQEETKLVYEKYGTSPTGGCLGSIIQLPILFALWPVVQNIPAYVKGVKEAYMPLVEGIKGTDGFQKIMEEIGSASPILISPDRYDYAKSNTIIDVLYKFQSSTWETLVDKFPDLEKLIHSTKDTVSHMNVFCGINIAETPMSMFKDSIAAGAIGMAIVAVLIPILAGATQLISAKIAQSSTNTNNKNDKENAMAQQMNMMLKIMPLISVFMCFSMPAGLGLYWITSAVVRSVQQFAVNKYLDKKSIDDMVKANVEKAAKKRKNKKEVSSTVLNQMAQKSTRSVEFEQKQVEETQRKTTSNNNVESYKKNAKPGSLASKANMVSDFNNRNR